MADQQVPQSVDQLLSVLIILEQLSEVKLIDHVRMLKVEAQFSQAHDCKFELAWGSLLHLIDLIEGLLKRSNKSKIAIEKDLLDSAFKNEKLKL